MVEVRFVLKGLLLRLGDALLLRQLVVATHMLGFAPIVASPVVVLVHLVVSLSFVLAVPCACQ